MRRYKQFCLTSAVFAAAACANTVCLAVEPAPSAPAPEQVWSSQLDRYLSITDSPETMSDAAREEAAGIISKFRLLIGSSTYAPPGEASGFDTAKSGARAQADQLLGLLKEMKVPAPPLAGNPEFARESAPEPGLSQDAARAKALKLLEALAGRLKIPRKISGPVLAPGTAPAPRLKGTSFKPFQGIGSGGRCGAPEYYVSGSPGRKRVFKMKGYFEGEFPAWQWCMSGTERSAGGGRPYSEGTLTPMGLFLGEIHEGKPARKKYKFHWKDRKGKPASQAIAAQARGNPDLTGDLVEETDREVIIDPGLKGTPFMVRGFSLGVNLDLPCGECSEKWWSASADVIYWPAKENCGDLVKTWTPALPGDVKNYTPLVPLKSAGAYSAPEKGAGRSLFEMRYVMNLYRCSRPVHYVPQKVQVLCVQGRKGLYTLTFDATEEIFDKVLPEFENIGRSFKLAE